MKRFGKKAVQMSLSAFMAAGMLSGCGSENSQSAGRTGTYYGEADGFGGKVTAYVTLDNGTITDVKLYGDNETQGKGSVAIEEMAPLIVEHNSADVDMTTGATVTSTAIKNAVQQALDSTAPTEAPAESAAAAVSYTPGTYTGTGFGHNNPISVEVTVSKDAIESVVVTEDSSDTAMHDATVDEIPSRIVDGQSLNIDIVTGATETSTGILNAVADALEQASDEETVSALRSKERTVESAEDKTYEADAVVVGGGGSGLVSAYSLADQGYSVVVMEAADILGGMTNVCGGGSMSFGSQYQQNAYADKSAEEYQKEEYDILMNASGNQANASFLQAYDDALGNYVDWASDAGIPYTASGRGGNESPVSVRLDQKGSRFYQIISKMNENADVTILTGTRGEELILDDGSVAGVRGTGRNGETVSVRADVVVLATGGFLSNTDMVKEYIPQYTEYFENWSGSSRYQGDGIRMAWSAGAKTAPFGIQPHDSMIPEAIHRLNIPTHSPSNYSDAAYYPSLWVNSEGKRFVNEDIATAEGAEAHGAAQMAVGNSYTILDQTLIDKLVSEGSGDIGGWMSTRKPDPDLEKQIDEVISLGNGYAYKADTLEELADMIGCNAETLQQTVKSYNAAVAQGEDSEFGKDSRYLVDTIETGPYYALENVTRVLGAYGGIEVDENMAVLDEDGNEIAGLYAAGLDAGTFMGDVYSVTTTTAAFAVCSGYMVGNGAGAYLASIKK